MKGRACSGDGGGGDGGGEKGALLHWKFSLYLFTAWKQDDMDSSLDDAQVLKSLSRAGGKKRLGRRGRITRWN